VLKLQQESFLTITVVVVAYNGLGLLEQCLESLLHSDCPLEIIVVDNGSDDGTTCYVSNLEGIQLLRLHENLGFGRANNKGMQYALRNGADYVMLLNQDAYVDSHTIGTLVGVMERHRDFGIASPIHFMGTKDNLDKKFAFYLGAYSPKLLFDMWRGGIEEIYPVDFVNAAAWLIRRECLESVGGFDPLFFMYGEDEDYCRRARYHGFRVGVVPRACAYHYRHRPSQHQVGRWQGLSQRANRMVSGMLLALKDLDHSLWEQMVVEFLAQFPIGARMFFHGDKHGLAALGLAVSRILIMLPRIARHRSICRRKGPHWIDTR